MKLISITWSSTPRMPGLRPTDLGKIDCDNPNGPMKDWRAVIRGPQMFLISPTGWLKDQSAKRGTSGCTVFGPIPVSDVYLEWHAETEAEVAAMTKPGNKIEHETQPFGWRPTPIVSDKPILDQIPPGQMGDA